MMQIQLVRVGSVLVPIQRQRDSCFSGGTLVHTQNGMKAIADLSKHDKILCTVAGFEIDAEIQTVTKRSSKEGFEAITLGTAEEDITVTVNHAVGLAGGGFAFVGGLANTDGGSLRSLGGKATIVKVKHYTKLHDIYNVVIAAADPHSCYAVGKVGFAASDRL